MAFTINPAEAQAMQEDQAQLLGAIAPSNAGDYYCSGHASTSTTRKARDNANPTGTAHCVWANGKWAVSQ
ncbi:hypothetical protein [Phormidesmis priestleyi]